jgi:dTMP kinase
MAGIFITLEGGEGGGKSTQINMLADALERAGHTVHRTREPGGSPGAEDIRRLLVDGEPDRWTGATETLLHFAARHDHLQHTILPALARGDWVLSDRFADSTYAYQGYGHGQDLKIIDRLYQMVAGDLRPDLTIILDLPVDVGLKRAADRNGGEDRYERMYQSFHDRLRQGFLKIAEGNPERCAVVDADKSIDEVSRDIFAVVHDRLGISLP